MLRAAKWPGAARPLDAHSRALAGCRSEARDLERLTLVERRQESGQTLREQGLAGAGRADHEHGVAARGGDLERTLGGELTAYL